MYTILLLLHHWLLSYCYSAGISKVRFRVSSSRGLGESELVGNNTVMINFPYLHSFPLSFVGHYSRDTPGLSHRAKHSVFPKAEFGTDRKFSCRENHEPVHISAREAFLIDVKEILNGRHLTQTAKKCIMN